MIPKIIYQTWFSRDLPEKYVKIKQQNEMLNPDYSFQLFDNQELNVFFDQLDIPLWKDAYFRIHPKYGAARADLFRYIIIYQQGGIYLDIKIQCRVPLNSWIDGSKKGYFSYWKEKYNSKYLKNKKGELQNWFLVMQPKDHHLFEMIHLICNQIMNAPSSHNFGKLAVLMYTGPIAMSKFMIPRLGQYQLIESHSYFHFHINSHSDSYYQHYSTLQEPLFLPSSSPIPPILWICSPKYHKEGFYLFKPYRSLLPMIYIIKNCDVVIGMKKGELYVLAFHKAMKGMIKDLIQHVQHTNQYRVFYFHHHSCIKQVYITEDNHLMYDYMNYCKFES